MSGLALPLGEYEDEETVIVAPKTDAGEKPAVSKKEKKEKKEKKAKKLALPSLDDVTVSVKDTFVAPVSIQTASLEKSIEAVFEKGQESRPRDEQFEQRETLKSLSMEWDKAQTQLLQEQHAKSELKRQKKELRARRAEKEEADRELPHKPTAARNSRNIASEQAQQRQVARGESFEGRSWKSREEMVMRQSIDG